MKNMVDLKRIVDVACGFVRKRKPMKAFDPIRTAAPLASASVSTLLCFPPSLLAQLSPSSYALLPSTVIHLSFPVVGLVAAVGFTQLLKRRRLLQLRAVRVERN